MPVSIREYKGTKYIFGDFTNMSSTKSVETVEELARVIKAQGGKVRVLCDYTGAALGPDYMSRAKALGKELNAAAERQALLGIDGLKRMLLTAYVKFTGAATRAFDHEAEALDYLVS